MAAVLFVELPSANTEPPRETAAAFLFRADSASRQNLAPVARPAGGPHLPPV